MTADGGEALWRTCVCPFMRVAEHWHFGEALAGCGPRDATWGGDRQ